MPTPIVCKKFFRIVPALCFVMVVSVCGLAVYSQELIDILILRGDKVTITVLEQEDLNGVYAVASDGRLEFPLVAEAIRAEGLTCNELAARLKQELEKDYFYQATVIVKPFEEEEEEIEVIATEDEKELSMSMVW
jgi:protein involved in polysaccharide export with SLBB domain